jgi:hypothetical protein
MVRHHFLIVAVPVGAGVAIAEMLNCPDTFELFVVVHATLGIVFVWLMVRMELVAMRFEVSVIVT